MPQTLLRTACILYYSHTKQSYLHTKFTDWSCQWKQSVLYEVRTEYDSVDEFQSSDG